MAGTMGYIICADNMDILPNIRENSIDLIYIDPPFNTGKIQKYNRIKTIRDDKGGDRTGYQDKRYKSVHISSAEYVDTFDDYIEFIYPRLLESYRILKPTGSFFLHIDYREVHYCKILLDHIFGRDCFMNEIIWAYDYGARSKRRWSTKHDNILWYVKDNKNYTFNYNEIDRIPYMAPNLVGPEKAINGKTPTDVWWHTIVPTNSKERVGYPTQKPLGIVLRIVKVHSNKGDICLDFFAGSGTLGYAAAISGRDYILIDNNPEAINIIRQRLQKG